MINVVHITPHLGGGIGKAIIGLCSSIKSHGIKSCVMVLEQPEKPGIIESAVDNGVDVALFPDKKVMQEVLNNADVIVLNWWDHPLANKFLHDYSEECRMVVWCHTNGCTYPYLQSDFLLKFDRIIFTTPYSLKNQLWDADNRKKIIEKHSVVYGFGDFEPQNIKCKNSWKIGNKVRIGYAGTLNYSKMFSDYIKYTDMVLNALNDVEIHLAGDVSVEIEKDINKSDHKNQYVLDGYVTDMGAWYDSIDIFLYLLNPTHYGTTENSILEAMSRGIPVVLMDGVAERFISGDGKGAILIKDGNQLVKEIKHLCCDIKYREKIGLGGRDYTCDAYSAEKNVIVFLNTMLDAMMKCSKTKHDFNNCIGRTPGEWFLSSTGNEREIFELFLTTGDTKGLYELIEKKGIYTVESKSSINQFFKYFPYDEILRSLKRNIERGQV